MVLDEDLLVEWVAERNYAQVGRNLGVSRQYVRQRIDQLREILPDIPPCLPAGYILNSDTAKKTRAGIKYTIT